MFLPVFEANFSNAASDVPGEKKRNKEEIEKNKNKKKSAKQSGRLCHNYIKKNKIKMKE